MNKRKLVIMMASVALIGAVGIGATLAYFTDSEVANNTVVMGNVNIELDEPSFRPTLSNNAIGDVVPNQEITKDPTITLQEGSEDAYVRVKIDVTGLNEGEMSGITEYIDANLNTGWVKGADGLYYFNSIMSLSGTKTTTVFNKIKIPATWTNTSADKTFNIVITAEAIQAAWLEDGIVSLSANNVGWDLTGIAIEEYVAPVAP